MGTLGHKIFVPLSVNIDSDIEDTSDGDEPELYLNRTIKQINFNVKAFGKQTSDGFVVLKGSRISPKDDSTISTKVFEIRKNRKVDKNNILLEDVLFNTPSGAAQFVIGKSSNGWIEWRTEDGKTLRDLEYSEENSNI